MTEQNMEFRLVISEARKAFMVSDEELATIVGVTPSTIAAWGDGEIIPPDIMISAVAISLTRLLQDIIRPSNERSKMSETIATRMSANDGILN